MKTFWRLNKKDHYTTAILLKKIITELRDCDVDDICNDLRGSGLEFYHVEKIKAPFWVRLTLPFAFVVIGLLFILLPINYLITGYWGYRWPFITNWFRSLGF